MFDGFDWWFGASVGMVFGIVIGVVLSAMLLGTIVSGAVDVSTVEVSFNESRVVDYGISRFKSEGLLVEGRGVKCLARGGNSG